MENAPRGVIGSGLTRNQLATAAGTGGEAIRFYEAKGLLPAPRRDTNGYRRYDGASVQRLHFIQRAKELGFTLQEIRELLELEAQGSSRAELKQRTEEKLAVIHRKIAGLSGMAAALESLVNSCSGSGPLAGCPIYEHMAHEAPVPTLSVEGSSH